MLDKKYNISILYVEDDESIRNTLTLALKKIFTSVNVASNAEDGLEIFQNDYNNNKNIALIITDLKLPKINGLEMLVKIRELNSCIYSIVMSAYNFNDYMKESKKINIYNIYLPKPFTTQNLFLIIDDIMDKLSEKIQFLEDRSLYMQYKNAIDYSNIISKIDLEGRVTYVNDSFLDISGYTKKEILGTYHLIKNKEIIKEDIYNTLWKTIKSKLIYKYENMKHKAKDGSYYYTNTVIIPILDKDRNIYEYILMMNDTTKIYNLVLLEEESKQSKQNFFASMSHELRTPLNGMIGFIKLLKESILQDKQKEYVDIIDSSATSLHNTIDSILNLSKLQSDKFTLENINFDPNIELKNVLKLFEAKAKQKNISLIYDCNLDEKTILNGDIFKLKQVISNLINNAIKFTNKNGKIIFNTNFSKIINNKIKIDFSIKDNGIGIDKDKQKMIFTPYLQANSHIERTYGGTGLGLSISKEITKVMGGELKVDSVLNKGSDFYFSLEFKCIDSTVNHNKENNNNNNTKYNNTTVLIAEDEPINQKLLEIIFTQKDMKVIIANNGDEAVKLFQKNIKKIDIVFLDINMPILNGMEACEQINISKKENMITNIPIIALTANAFEEDKQNILNNGFDEYLTKPLNNDELFKILEKYLGKSILTQNAKTLGIPSHLYNSLINKYFTMMKEELPVLHKHLIDKNFKEAHNLAHKLKGTSANLLFDTIYELLEEVELSIKNKKINLNLIASIQNDLDVHKIS